MRLREKKETTDKGLILAAFIVAVIGFWESPRVVEYFRTLGDDASEDRGATKSPEIIAAEALLPHGVTLTGTRLSLLEFAMGAHDALMEMPSADPSINLRELYRLGAAHPYNLHGTGLPIEQTIAYRSGHAAFQDAPGASLDSLYLAMRMPDAWYDYLAKVSWVNGEYDPELFARAFAQIIPLDVAVTHRELADWAFALIFSDHALEKSHATQAAIYVIPELSGVEYPHPLGAFQEALEREDRPSTYLRDTLDVSTETAP